MPTHEVSIPTESVPNFTNYSDLASELVGGKIIFATDDWFATAENMLQASDAVFKPGLFTDYGKWMDGWETRRKRIPGHDWCIIQLGCPGVIHGIELSTHHFTGNYPPRASLQAACLDEDLPARMPDRMGTAASRQEFENIRKLHSEDWSDIVPISKLRPGVEATHRNWFPVQDKRRITHLRLNIYPDGGIARIRVYGEAQPDWNLVPKDELVDLIAMVNGGSCLDFSNAHYGHARNVIAPGRARKMDEGWETARRMDRPAILEEVNGVMAGYGGEWAIYRLGHAGTVHSIEVDTNHFKGNCPFSFYLCGTYIDQTCEDENASYMKAVQSAVWKPILHASKLQPHHEHTFGEDDVVSTGIVNHVRLTITPDGGISRMKIFGKIRT